MIFFCDACPCGLGLWIPSRKKGFTYSLPAPYREIYWAELTAAVACIILANNESAKRIVIFTDSENVVDLFSSHRAIEIVREMFKTAIDLMLHDKLDVIVKHVSGERNVIADCLSRNNLSLAKELIGDLEIKDLVSIPPKMNGGIRKKVLKI